MQKPKAPIVLFAFNRPAHLQQVLEALAKNTEAIATKLYVFIDGPRAANFDSDAANIADVRKIVQSSSGFLSVDIHQAESNLGLAESVIRGMNQILETHERVIVLEDDILVSPNFLRFMNDGLEMYKDSENVFGLSGFTFKENLFKQSSVFLPLGSSWGWATWRRAWKRINFNGPVLAQEIAGANKVAQFNFGGYRYFDMLQDFVNGRNNSWAVRFYASMFLQEGVFLYPNASLVRNIGFDNSGTHNNAVFVQNSGFVQQPVELVKQPTRLDSNIVRRYRQAFEEIFNTKRFTFRKLLRKIGILK